MTGAYLAIASLDAARSKGSTSASWSPLSCAADASRQRDAQLHRGAPPVPPPHPRPDAVRVAPLRSWPCCSSRPSRSHGRSSFSVPRLRAGLRSLPPAGGTSPGGSPDAGRSPPARRGRKAAGRRRLRVRHVRLVAYLYNATFWVMTISDRYLIAYFWSSREVGLYAINYGFCAMPYLMLNGWIELDAFAALWPRRRRGPRRRPDNHEGAAPPRGRRQPRGDRGPVVPCRADRPAAARHELLAGVRLAMILCAAYAFYVMGNVFHSLFIAMKRAEVLARTALLAAATNVSLNLWWCRERDRGSRMVSARLVRALVRGALDQRMASDAGHAGGTTLSAPASRARRAPLRRVLRRGRLPVDRPHPRRLRPVRAPALGRIQPAAGP